MTEPYLVFVWKSTGYELHEREGEVPALGTEVEENGGRLEVAQQMANHESARTTGLYDRRGDEIFIG